MTFARTLLTAFIALTRTDMEALLDYVERLKAERDEAVSMMSRMCGDA